MDPLAITAAALVAQSALQEVGQKVGDAGWASLGAVAQFLRRRFEEDEDVAGAELVSSLEQAPDSPSRLTALAGHLDLLLQDEDHFRQELNRHVTDVSAVGGAVGAFVVNVQTEASVGKIVQIGVVNTKEFRI